MHKGMAELAENKGNSLKIKTKKPKEKKKKPQTNPPNPKTCESKKVRL